MCARGDGRTVRGAHQLSTNCRGGAPPHWPPHPPAMCVCMCVGTGPTSQAQTAAISTLPPTHTPHTDSFVTLALFSSPTLQSPLKSGARRPTFAARSGGVNCTGRPRPQARLGGAYMAEGGVDRCVDRQERAFLSEIVWTGEKDGQRSAERCRSTGGFSAVGVRRPAGSSSLFSGRGADPTRVVLWGRDPPNKFGRSTLFCE